MKKKKAHCHSVKNTPNRRQTKELDSFFNLTIKKLFCITNKLERCFAALLLVVK